MKLLGYDIGSSSVKASIIDANTGRCLGTVFFPKTEMEIKAVRPGWAEQHPDTWWQNLVLATREAIGRAGITVSEIKAIGISYQMHGLVVVDKNGNVLRPSIIWCDSRAVSIGEKAFREIGPSVCLEHLLNSPGNFTASKLRWIRENEPDIYRQIHKIMLPGDYIAWRLTGRMVTTPSGLSEGILWDFRKNNISKDILQYYDIDEALIPEVVPTFSVQGELTREAAQELGLMEGTPVAYRAGDQPNNALSLNVLNPGEIAATAGTSGVVYGVSEKITFDPKSRINTFAHVNHTPGLNRLGVLLCINGTGILNSWIRKHVLDGLNYERMNELAETIPPGSEGLLVLPFGNGAERMLENKDPGAAFVHLNFNMHTASHLIRAAHEGIVFSFAYGMEIMNQVGISPSVIRAGNANMFLSPVFRKSLSTLTNARIELYDTDGSQGAARGAGIGAGIYKNYAEAFSHLHKIGSIEPDASIRTALEEAYNQWKQSLENYIGKSIT
ncbi:MAG: xylulokinase [Bacteroidales bacterium]